jgi:hypothetical protein
VPFVFSPRDPAKQKVKNKQVKMAGARSENTLISEGAGRSVINKTSPRTLANKRVFVPRPRQAKGRLLTC